MDSILQCVCMCVRVCMCICVYVYACVKNMCVCICVHIHIYIYIYVCWVVRNREKESRMVVAKRQGREKPVKIEQRKVPRLE